MTQAAASSRQACHYSNICCHRHQLEPERTASSDSEHIRASSLAHYNSTPHWTSSFTIVTAAAAPHLRVAAADVKHDRVTRAGHHAAHLYMAHAVVDAYQRHAPELREHPRDDRAGHKRAAHARALQAEVVRLLSPIGCLAWSPLGLTQTSSTGTKGTCAPGVVREPRCCFISEHVLATLLCNQGRRYLCVRNARDVCRTRTGLLQRCLHKRYYVLLCKQPDCVSC